jgi:hypothetical protein
VSSLKFGSCYLCIFVFFYHYPSLYYIHFAHTFLLNAYFFIVFHVIHLFSSFPSSQTIFSLPAAFTPSIRHEKWSYQTLQCSHVPTAWFGLATLRRCVCVFFWYLVFSLSLVLWTCLSIYLQLFSLVSTLPSLLS